MNFSILAFGPIYEKIVPMKITSSTVDLFSMHGPLTLAHDANYCTVWISLCVKLGQFLVLYLLCGGRFFSQLLVWPNMHLDYE